LNTSQDFTTGQEENKTDQCGVSKKDYNWPIKVTVGSSFGLKESQQAEWKQ
jgi:hypothetical protein